MPLPRVLLVDNEKLVYDQLHAKGFNVTVGTFGQKYECRADIEEEAVVRWSLPSLIEQDIVVVDSSEPRAASRSPETGYREVRAASDVIVKQAGQNYFNPRPLVARSHRDAFRTVLESGGVVVVKMAAPYTERYARGHRTEGFLLPGTTFQASSYDFLPVCPVLRVGDQRLDVSVPRRTDYLAPLRNVLNRFQTQLQARVVVPAVSLDNGSRSGLDGLWTVLAEDKFGDAVALAATFPQSTDRARSGLVLLLPESNQWPSLVTAVLEQALPEMRPDLFPELALGAWLDEDAYVPPSVARLKHERNELQSEYEVRLAAQDTAIAAEQEKYAFLRDLLAPTATDSELVDALEVYFCHLDVDRVENLDQDKEDDFEEDLQVWYSDVLLVVEAKGLSGFPRDNDANQVSKYVMRRSNELAGKGVKIHGIFALNHQRHLPPLDRDPNPFTESQVRDARISTAYSLVTTWQLFEAYLALERGELQPRDILASLRRPGRVEVLPEAWTRIGRVTHFYGKIQVAQVTLDQGQLAAGDRIGFLLDSRYATHVVTSLELDNTPVKIVGPDQPAGVLLGFDVPVGTEVFLIRNRGEASN